MTDTTIDIKWNNVAFPIHVIIQKIIFFIIPLMQSMYTYIEYDQIFFRDHR